MTDKRTFTVEINQKMHPGGVPEDEAQRIIWETLDTAWMVLAEQAVRLALHRMREVFTEAGDEFPSDEQIFADAQASGDPDAPAGYADLAVADQTAAAALEAAFHQLAESTLRAAADAFGVQIVEVEGE